MSATPWFQSENQIDVLPSLTAGLRDKLGFVGVERHVDNEVAPYSWSSPSPAPTVPASSSSNRVKATYGGNYEESRNRRDVLQQLQPGNYRIADELPRISAHF